MTVVPPLRRCTSYTAGHTVHWIQALHSGNKPEAYARTRTGVLVAVTGRLLALLFEAPEPELFFNHDPERLLAIAGRLPRRMTLNDQYVIMRIDGFCFSVLPAARGPLSACPTDEISDVSPEAVAERVGTRGGFSAAVHGRGG